MTGPIMEHMWVTSFFAINGLGPALAKAANFFSLFFALEEEALHVSQMCQIQGRSRAAGQGARPLHAAAHEGTKPWHMG